MADVSLSDDDIAAVVDTYRSGWLSMGPRTASFERALAEFTDSAHALAVANGTAALHLICLAAGARAGGRHVGTFGLAGAFSFFANKNLAVGEGGAVVTDDETVAERVRLMPPAMT